MRLPLIKYGNIADYNNNPPTSVSFIPAIAGTSGRLHSEFIRLLFLQDHRETDRFFLQIQEFNLRNRTVDSSTSVLPLYLCSLKQKSEDPSQGCSFTCQPKCRLRAYHIKNTHSPISTHLDTSDSRT